MRGNAEARDTSIKYVKERKRTQYHVSSTLRFVSFLVSIFFDVVELDGRLWHDTERSSTQKEDEQSRGRTD